MGQHNKSITIFSRLLSIIALMAAGAPFEAAAITPTIESISPLRAKPGATVVIDGRNLGENPLVTFNGTIASANPTAPTQMLATVPAGAASGPISITTAKGTVISDSDFTVLGTAPVIDSFSPQSGGAETQVVIEGVNFSGATSVTFNRTNEAPFEVTASTQIHTEVPAGAGTGPIEVTTPAGTATSKEDFIFLGAQPQIERFSPQAGAPDTEVTIEGARFEAGIEVKINNVQAQVVRHTSPSQLQIRVPNEATSGPITITSSRGTGTSANDFVVLREVNLGITIHVVPQAPRVSQPLTYRLEAKNNGNLPATGVSLFQILPLSVDVGDMRISHGSVTHNGRLIKADIGSLTNNMSATLEVDVVPSQETVLTNRAYLTVLEPDQDPFNNSSVTETSVSPGNLTLELSTVETNRLQLSWPAYPSNTTVQARRRLSPESTWTNLNVTPTQVNGRQLFPFTATEPESYYRLRIEESDTDDP